MTQRTSAPLRFRNSTFLVNNIDTMAIAPKRQKARFLRTKSAEAWSGCDPLNPDMPVIFTLHSLFHPLFENRLPDCDGLAWVAKRMLDGARDAKVIVDDSPQYVERVVLERTYLMVPVQEEEYPGTRILYQGEFRQIGT